jgi:AraC-like DNA-binding protein
MPGTPNLDLLSDVLRRVHLASAFFLRGEFSAPWGFESTDAATLAQVVAPGARHLVLLHLAVEGGFHIRLAGGECAFAQPGDAVVLPYCDVHSMMFPEGAQPVPIVNLLPAPPWKELPVVCKSGGGGAPTRILCGYLHCEDLLFNPVLRALPRLIHVAAKPGPAAEWRQASLRYVLENAGENALLQRLPELVLADCLRQYAESLPESEAGWLAALRDPVLAKVLVLLHAQPEQPWTVTQLARRAAVSRSVLAERFREALGVSPMRYLTQWRLQLAADMLRSGSLGIAALAARVGYDSEAAFSRAFKRHLGASPAAWRERRG